MSEEDYVEACRRYKDKRTKLPERQRYHALILASQGYSYKEIGRILLVDEETVSGWVLLYQEKGLDALKNHAGWGGEHGQRLLSTEQLAELTQTLTTEAMTGTQVGSGWTAKAIRKLIRERYEISYEPRAACASCCGSWGGAINVDASSTSARAPKNRRAFVWRRRKS